MFRISALVIFTVTLHDVLIVDGSYPERILLNDVSTLTLYKERFTNARRSNPIPQLRCVGGTAGCVFLPKVVQCYNRGTDGYSNQWECKTDMDQAYRFGELEVSCEGYDYPDDPYILKGSCGLEYTLDFTDAGYRQNKHQSQRNDYQRSQSHNGTSIVILFLLVAIVGFVLYKALTYTSTQPSWNYAGQEQYQFSSAQSPPPPPGFRPEYMPGNSYSTAFPGHHTQVPPSQSNTGGGFWTGLTTGGFLGYLFGSSRGNAYQYQHQSANPSHSYWGNPSHSNWGNTGFGSTSSSSGSAPEPSGGTRVTSGFGGTRRR